MRYAVPCILILLLFAPTQGFPATIHVPGDQPSIQAGISASGPGDTVLVACGTYYEHDVALRSGVVLISESAEAGCVTIDAGGQGPVMKCTNVDTSTALVGFTLTGGQGGGLACYRRCKLKVIDCAFVGNSATLGGGMYCNLSYPRVTRCTFSGNSATWGGGMYCKSSSPRLLDCSFIGNSASDGAGLQSDVASTPRVTRCAFVGNTSDSGGGVSCTSSSPELDGCFFADNSADIGGGMLVGPVTSPRLMGCTFAGNSGREGGGVHCCTASSAVCSNCTFYGNDGMRGGGVDVYSSHATLDNTIIAFSTRGVSLACASGGSATLTCCDLYGNAGGDWVGWIGGQAHINGNLSEDPLFCDPEIGNFTINEDSPCAAANSPSGCGLIGAHDVGCVGVLEATVDLDPDALNLKSKGNYATCYIELPDGYDPGDIDVSSVLLNGALPALSSPTAAGDHDGDGIADRMVKFNRSGMIALLGGSKAPSLWMQERGEAAPFEHGEEFEITVSGELADGKSFAGTDVVKVINLDGGSDGANLLRQNYPNPFQSGAATTIEYTVAKPGVVEVHIFDVAGRRVKTIVDQAERGQNSVLWNGKADDGRGVPSGVYYYEIRGEGFSARKRMVVVR